MYLLLSDLFLERQALLLYHGGFGCRLRFPYNLIEGSGFRVQGSGFLVQGSGFRVPGSGFRGQGLGFRVQVVWCRVQGESQALLLYHSGFGSRLRFPYNLIVGSGVQDPQATPRGLWGVNRCSQLKGN